MNKRIKKKHEANKMFNNDLSSLDDIPSITTSLNDAAECIESSENADAADKISAEISEVVHCDKVAEAAVTDEEPAETVIAAISEEITEKELPAAVTVCEEDIYCAEAVCSDGFDKSIYKKYENIFKKPDMDIIDKIYGFCVKVDDSLEYFRNEVMEIVSAAVLLGDLISHRVHQALIRVTGFRKTHGLFAVERRFEYRAEKIFDSLIDSQFGDLVEGIVEKKKSLENKVDVLASKKYYAVKNIESKIDALAELINTNKKHCSMGIATVVGCMMLFCVTVNAGTVYTYSYHGTELGTVKDKSEIETAIDQVYEIVPESRNVEVSVNAEPDVDITYEKEFNLSAVLDSNKLDSAEAAADKISNCDELQGSGFAIKINGVTTALVDTQETAEKIFEEIKRNYCTINPEEEAAVMAAMQADMQTAEAVNSEINADAQESASEAQNESTKVRAAAVEMQEIEADVATEAEKIDAESSATKKIDAAIIRNMILADRVNQQTGVVKAASNGNGDTDSSIIKLESKGVDYSAIDFSIVDPAMLEGISIDNVNFVEEVTIEPVTEKVSLFNDYDSAVKLFIDEENKSTLLTVNTSEIDVYEEEIPFETIYEESADIYEGETEVKTEGVVGVKQVIAGVVKENDYEVSRETIDEIITTEPVSEVILKGTKEKPADAGDSTSVGSSSVQGSGVSKGSFITPASGRITSGFGQRWGRNHNGLDIAGSHGSAIVAADGGTVIYAQYHNNGFGNLVKIRHNNGTETWYAHNSQLLVKVGDKVSQGQTIAKMGSTGRSTGTHCHFEVHVNGKAVNPANYLK